MIEATDRPWIIAANGKKTIGASTLISNDGWLIAKFNGPDAEANAALTVCAVNAHEALVEALEAVVPILPGYVSDLHSGGLEIFGAKVDGIAVKARAALALAEAAP